MTQDQDRAPKPEEQSGGDNGNDAPGAADEAGAGAAEAAAEPEAEAAPAAAPDPLAEAQAEIAELKDKYLRAMAEVENVRRRAARERDDASKYAIASLARELLSVVDNLERALASVPAEAREGDEALDALVQGIELTQREMAAVFERHAIKTVAALGEKFDHNLHQAVVEIEDAKAAPGTVVQVMQSGYTIADRLLRPAMVALAKGGPQQSPESGGEEPGEGAAADAEPDSGA